MSILKKTAAVLSAVMISATLFGCSDTSYIMKADGKEVKAGVYLNYVNTQMQSQIYNLQNSGVTANFLDQKIGDEDFSDYVADAAMTSTKEHVAISAKFEELGLEFDEDTIKEINTTVNDTWTDYKDTYEEQGVSKDSFKEIVTNSYKKSKIFNYYYGEGGEEEVTDEDITAYIEENYLRYKVLSFPKTTSGDEEDTETKADYEKYLEKAQDVDFAGFDALIEEYDAEQATESEDTTEETTEETEEDPYKNEQMTNYAEIDESSTETYETVVKEIKTMENGAVSSYEDDLAYYIYIKGDITERSAEYVEDDNRSSTVSEMKSDEFQKKIDDWVGAMKFDINKKALERYSVEEVYERQEKSAE